MGLFHSNLCLINVLCCYYSPCLSNQRCASKVNSKTIRRLHQKNIQFSLFRINDVFIPVILFVSFLQGFCALAWLTAPYGLLALHVNF